ncbi:MAG: segregation/condensation protein A, partial [Pseudomonadota bacterium]|nr:segregation/condensation protein A [Pseudomonadota bacterium]
GDNRRRTTFPQLTIEASQLFSLSEAIERLTSIIGNVGDWTSLTAFLPDDIADGILRRSAVASTFAASLELVKEGKAKIRQSSANGPIYLKREEAAING